VSGLALLPNLCTAANLLLGVTAITAVFNNNLQLAAILIVFAAVLDRFDGILARKCNAESAFGREFDSLADLVSFGVAPASLLYVSAAGWNTTAALIVFGLFTLCGAFRLARFNVSTSSGSTKSFQGVPITAAGSILAVLVYLIPNVSVNLALGVLLSMAMISKIRIPKI